MLILRAQIIIFIFYNSHKLFHKILWFHQNYASKKIFLMKKFFSKIKKISQPHNPFTAWKYFDGAPRNYPSTSPTNLGDTRISLAKAQPVSSATTKLDIHQKNQYNRANHSSHIYNNNNNNRIGSSSSYPITHLASSHLDQSNDLAYHHQQPTSSSSISPTRSSSHTNSYNRTSAIFNQSNSSHSNSRFSSDTLDPYVDEQAASDNRQFTERRKKTVRFDGQDLDELSRWESERQESQDSTTKDSGIDTSSTFTSSEDSNRGDGPKV